MSQRSSDSVHDGIVGPYETRRGPRWGVRCKINGRIFERSGLRSKGDAEHIRNKARTEAYEQSVSPERAQARLSKNVTIADLLELVVKDFRRNSYSSITDAVEHQRFWTEFKGSLKATAVTGSMLRTWADTWILEGLAPGTVNRKMAKLLRGYAIAIEEEEPPLLATRPRWVKLHESDPRSGFLDWDLFVPIRGELREAARIPATIGYWTGMRLGEIVGARARKGGKDVPGLQWNQVTFDHQARTVRIQLTGNTKNGQPRQVIMPDDLYDILWAWREQTRHVPCLAVCQERGRPLRSVAKGWNGACIRLGLGRGTWDKTKGFYRDYEGPIFHDLRRTGLRNMIRAGVDRDTAKSISGHLTDSVFTRYNIVDERNLIEAGRKVTADTKARFSGGGIGGVGNKVVSISKHN